MHLRARNLVAVLKIASPPFLNLVKREDAKVFHDTPKEVPKISIKPASQSSPLKRPSIKALLLEMVHLTQMEAWLSHPGS